MPGCRARAGAAGAVRAAGTDRAAGAAGEAQAAEATAITMTGTSSKDNHRRRIHDLRTRSGAWPFRPADRLIPNIRFAYHRPPGPTYLDQIPDTEVTALA